MTNQCYRGVVRGGMVVLLEEEASLKEGAEVLVTPVPTAPGSSVAVLAALASAPQVPAAWVDELEQLIAEGRRPPALQDPLSAESAIPEGK